MTPSIPTPRKLLKTSEEIRAWLRQMDIRNYSIRVDLSVEVHNSVWISRKNLHYLPVNFYRVDGHFDIDNNYLTSLEGLPQVIEKGLLCANNNLLSFKGCPKKVGEDFHCGGNPNLRSVLDLTSEIGTIFNFSNSPIEELKSIAQAKGEEEISGLELKQIREAILLKNELSSCISNGKSQPFSFKI